MFNLLYQNFYSMKKCKADIYKLLKFILAIILSFMMLLITFFCAVFCVFSFTFQNTLLVYFCVYVEFSKRKLHETVVELPFPFSLPQLVGGKISLGVCFMNLRKLNYLTFIIISFIINVFKNWWQIRK